MTHSERLALPTAGGSWDVLENHGACAAGTGWFIYPGVEFAGLELCVDGVTRRGVLRPVDRMDLVDAFSWSPGVQPVGFSFAALLEAPGSRRIDVLGSVDGRPAARLSCLLPELASLKAQPPDRLTERVAGTRGSMFRLQGLRMFSDLTDQMTRFGMPAAGRILDWGCGCGRVTQYLLARLPGAEVAGCDLDSESIAWCRENLNARFDVVRADPPTPYPDASFDIILGCSVLTHLDEDRQESWLEEMRRLLTPGGHILASVHGEYAYAVAAKGACRWDVSIVTPGLEGFLDIGTDPQLDGIAPPGCYRTVFQTRAHTLARVGKRFQVVDYVARGLNGHQDLLILRRTGE